MANSESGISNKSNLDYRERSSEKFMGLCVFYKRLTVTDELLCYHCLCYCFGEGGKHFAFNFRTEDLRSGAPISISM